MAMSQHQIQLSDHTRNHDIDGGQQFVPA